MNKIFKVIGDVLELIVMLILLPFVLLFRLVVVLAFFAVPVLIVATPFILIGFIVWVIFK